MPTNYVAQALVKLQSFTKKKVVVTYEAADELTGETVAPDGVKKPFIFHLGSPFPHKNIRRLVEAFSKLKPQNSSLQLVLAGKKEYYFEKLEEALQSQPIKNAVVLPGRVSDAELKWLYQNAEAYVLPSLSEGFGLPGLEAMVHGCPVASSNATCLPEIYGDAANYFDPKNVDDMAKAIAQIIDSETVRQELIGAGKKQAAKYSWAKMSEETLAIYKKVLG